MEEILTAAEARAKALEASSPRCKASVDYVLKRVKEAAKENELSTKIAKIKFNNESLMVLRSWGYSISFENEWAIINW